MRSMTALLLTALLAGPLTAQEYRWVKTGSDLALFQHGKQVGLLSAGVYRPWDGRAWGPPEPPPMAAPKVDSDGSLNFGLDTGRIPQATGYWINGKDSTRHQAFGLLGAGDGQLADDSARLRLTVNIADEATRKRVLADWASNPAFADLRDKVLVQDYSPQDWAVADVGMPTGIVLQAPPGKDGRGKVLLRLEQYGTPEALAESIRRADPSFRPDKVPNGGGLNILPINLFPINLPPSGLILGGVILAAAFWRATRGN